MRYFYSHLIKIFGQVKIYGDSSDPKAYSVNSESIWFKDFRLLVPTGTLKEIAINYNVPTKKADFDITKIEAPSDYAKDAVKKVIISYCIDDCKALMYIFFKFFISMKQLCDQLSNQ